MANAYASKTKRFCVALWMLTGIFSIFHAAPAPAEELGFLPVATYDTGGRPASSVAVADVNGDGDADVVVTNCGGCYGPPRIRTRGSVGVLLGNGDGIFQPAAIYDAEGQVPISVAVADMNGDGNPDLLVVNRNSHDLSILTGNGDGTFRFFYKYAAVGPYPLSAAVADVNGDGRLDFVEASSCASESCRGLVGVHVNNGDGSFGLEAYGAGGMYASAVAVADVNGDARPDVFVGVRREVCSGETCYAGADSVGVLMGNGDGTFQGAQTYLVSDGNRVPPFSSFLAVADVDDDGKPDLVVQGTAASGNGLVGVLLGSGDGTFRTAAHYGTGAGGWGTSVAVDDVNGDGTLDIVATDQCAALNCVNHGLVAALLGRGDGTFETARTYSAGDFLTNSAAIADVNGDRKPDVVVANMCADDTLYCTRASVGVLVNHTSFCTAPPLVTISVAPTTLWPPNGRMMPLAVSGTVASGGCTLESTRYVVKDEYLRVQPSGAVTVRAGETYGFTLWLQASRLGADLDGRAYGVTVSATNEAGEIGSASETVVVPHDRRN